MDLAFNEEQEMLRGLVRGVCAEHSLLEVVREMEDDARGYPDALWKQVSEVGLGGLLIPEAYGGSDQELLDAVVVYEEFGRALAPRRPGSNRAMVSVPRECSCGPKRRARSSRSAA
jgi:alkylation response protein AidB-like acyl-CoA dehydrogenase